MYIKDTLKIVDPLHQILDSSEFVYMKAPCVYLDHSCDNWVIGGPKEVEALIEDLQKVLHKWQDKGQQIESILDKVP